MKKRRGENDAEKSIALFIFHLKTSMVSGFWKNPRCMDVKTSHSKYIIDLLSEFMVI